MRYFIRIFSAWIIALLLMGAGTEKTKLTEGIQPGNLAPEINLQEMDWKGSNYVLVQFWAAYDPQSRIENIRMHQVLSHSQTDNIRLISISMDENPAVFQGVIKTDGLDEATQLNEPDGKHSKLFRNFRLKTGFGNWLIDSSGVIVARNVSPTEISKMISL